MGLQEIQQRLGLSRQRIQQLSGRDGFPSPYQTLAMGRVWLADEIETWIRTHRPARARSTPPDRQQSQFCEGRGDRAPNSSK
ncbi:helix-turn-helix transcriptional regulator [Actinoplanes sp. L3-i22]|uniref:helix-turn-helix transcriptional regulator n=1 Tax=Actinoplanes sp. L3-i22 TaxID=2836373 RepID=UPI00351D5717